MNIVIHVAIGFWSSDSGRSLASNPRTAIQIGKSFLARNHHVTIVVEDALARAILHRSKLFASNYVEEAFTNFVAVGGKVVTTEKADPEATTLIPDVERITVEEFAEMLLAADKVFTV